MPGVSSGLGLPGATRQSPGQSQLHQDVSFDHLGEVKQFNALLNPPSATHNVHTSVLSAQKLDRDTASPHPFTPTRIVNKQDSTSNKFSGIRNTQYESNKNPNQLQTDTFGHVQAGASLTNAINQTQQQEAGAKVEQIDRADPNTEVFSWGCDKYGQLGLGEEIHKQEQQEGGGSQSFNHPQPRFCIYGISIMLVACGDEHAAFVTRSNHIYSMGSNRCGQLGIRDTTITSKDSPVLVEQLLGNKIVDISCGGAHTLVATQRGDAYAWGEGRYGAIGTPDTETDQYRPQKVIFQDNSNSHVKVVHIYKVSAGAKHSAFLDQNGIIFTCGSNETGQLGMASRSISQMPRPIENFDKEAVQVTCGKHHTLILTSSGLVYGCGSNVAGQLGVPTDHPSTISPILVEDISHIPMRSIAAGTFSASIAKETGSLYLWGTGTFGEFQTPHRVRKIEQRALQVSIGDCFGMALTEDRRIYTWGINNNGQLGSGDFTDKPTPQLMQQISSEGRMIAHLSCGSNFALCIGQSTGLTVMDEQRKALEQKITVLQQAQTRQSSTDRKKRGKSKRDAFKQSMMQKPASPQGPAKKDNERPARDRSKKSQQKLKKSLSQSTKNFSNHLPQKPLDGDKTGKGKSKEDARNAASFNSRRSQISPPPNRKAVVNLITIYQGGKAPQNSKSQRIKSSVPHRPKSGARARKPKTSLPANQHSVSLKKRRSLSGQDAAVNQDKSPKRKVPRSSKSRSASTGGNPQAAVAAHPEGRRELVPEQSQQVRREQPRLANQAPSGQVERSSDIGHLLHDDNYNDPSAKKSSGPSTLVESPNFKEGRQSDRMSADQDQSRGPGFLTRPNEDTLGFVIEQSPHSQPDAKADSAPASPPPAQRTSLSQEGKDSAAPAQGPPTNEHMERYVDTKQQPLNLERVYESKTDTRPPLTPSDWAADQTHRTKESRPGDESRQREKDPHNATQSVSDHYFEGGDRSSRDDKFQISQLQGEVQKLRQLLDVAQGETQAQAQELRELHNRSRSALNDSVMHESRVQQLETELNLARQDRNRFQDEAQVERSAAIALKQEVGSLRLALSDMQAQFETQKTMNLQMNQIQDENRRLRDIEVDLKGVLALRHEDQDACRRLTGAVTNFEAEMGRKTYELQQKDDAIRQIDMDVREMQSQIEREEKNNEILRVENEGLRRDIENLRTAEDAHRQVQAQYENERQIRINSEGDIARLREQLADQMATSGKEIENLRRALDDMRYQNEEGIRQINIKNEEIEAMMDQLDNLGRIIDKKENDIVDLKASIMQLEMKNRKLNETVNAAIYGKTQENIDKTMDVMKRRGTTMDHERIRKLKSQGIHPTSDARLQGLMQEEALTPETALQQLEQQHRKQEMLGESQNARNAFNDPARSTAAVIERLEDMQDDGTQYRMPFKRVDHFNQSGPGFTPAPGTNMTPLQADIHNQGIDHQDWQTPGSSALYPGKYEPPRTSTAGRFQPVEQALRIPQSEEEVIRNRAETQMTSNMIKNSLAELRQKLTQMKGNKASIAVGMRAIDAKQASEL